MYFVYILASKRNGTLYIGITNDLIGRTYKHKHQVYPGFTSEYGVDKLVYYETHEDIEQAIKREKQLGIERHWVPACAGTRTEE